jgi:long-subunit fatty acid transport protein
MAGFLRALLLWVTHLPSPFASQVKLIELTVMNHQLVALVRIFALDLRLADDAQTKSAQSAAACEAERKSIAVQLAKARDEMTLSNSTHETQQNVSHITIKDLETK